MDNRERHNRVLSIEASARHNGCFVGILWVQSQRLELKEKPNTGCCRVTAKFYSFNNRCQLGECHKADITFDALVSL